MIYLTGDPHGEITAPGLNQFLEQATDSDLLIILGDLELNFRDTEENRAFTKWFLSLDRQIAFLDGNHENHPYLMSFPTETWYGGNVHRLTDNIVHLMRGEIYTLNGKTLFTMGGCKSSAKWEAIGLVYDGEVPSEAEIEFACRNLERYGNRVDYVLSHKYKDHSAEEITPLTLEALTMHIDQKIDFDHWYCGHWHKDFSIDDRHSGVFTQLLPLIQ